MKVIVDATIFTREAGAFGNVSGSIDLSCEPRIGDTISFSTEKIGREMPPGFTGLLRVRNRVLTAGGDPHGPLGGTGWLRRSRARAIPGSTRLRMRRP